MCANGRCINTLGSYRCSCNKAFKVDHTGTHCNGKQILRPLVYHDEQVRVYFSCLSLVLTFGLELLPTGKIITFIILHMLCLMIVYLMCCRRKRMPTEPVAVRNDLSESGRRIRLRLSRRICVESRQHHLSGPG